MKSGRSRSVRHRILRLSTCVCAVAAGLIAARAALADQASGNVCMGTLFFNATGQRLNCTSNDVKIAKALSVSPTTCTSGTMFDLTATFKVVLSGGGSNQTRYDLGLYFDTAGDPEHDGARGGSCTLNVIEQGDPGYLQLDASPDICGDINTAHNPLFPVVTLHGVVCTDTDGDGFLNLPNCTSWRQPGANQVCAQATDAYPGTSSKCNCNDTFNVPVMVEQASATLSKNPVQAVVTYEVNAANSSSTRTLRLDSLCDDTYGTIAGSGCPAGSSGTTISSTTCSVPQTLTGTSQAGAHDYTCRFDVNVDAPGSASPVTDIVTGTLVDTGNNATVEPVGSATVTVSLPQNP